MKVGIIGLKGSGKTTVLSALTGIAPSAGGGKKASIASLKVPDARLDELAAFYKPRKVTYPVVTFSDIAGGLKKPSKDGGLDPELVGLMKGMEALALVVPDFEQYRSASEGKFSQVHEARTIEAELILADMGPIERKLKVMEKQASKGMEKDVLEKCLACINEEKPLRVLGLNEGELKAVYGFSFLSLLPVLYLVNVDDERMDAELNDELVQLAKGNDATIISMAAKIEMEVALMPEEERGEFLKEMGLGEGARDRFIKKSWKMLDLVSFYTVGDDENKVWPVRQGTKAPGAAGKVHTDMERGFIRAEVFTFNDFKEFGSEAEIKSHGKMRLEGKDYVVEDGDVINFRFNV